MWVNSDLDTVLTRTVNILTTNALVKLTMFWTTGPSFLFLVIYPALFVTFILVLVFCVNLFLLFYIVSIYLQIRQGYVQWAKARPFLQGCMWTQRRLGSACALAQSDRSSQGILWVAKDPKRLQADREDSDQTAHSNLCLVPMQSCRKCRVPPHIVSCFSWICFACRNDLSSFIIIWATARQNLQ